MTPEEANLIIRMQIALAREGTKPRDPQPFDETVLRRATMIAIQNGFSHHELWDAYLVTDEEHLDRGCDKGYRHRSEWRALRERQPRRFDRIAPPMESATFAATETTTISVDELREAFMQAAEAERSACTQIPCPPFIAVDNPPLTDVNDFAAELRRAADEAEARRTVGAFSQVIPIVVNFPSAIDSTPTGNDSNQHLQYPSEYDYAEILMHDPIPDSD